MVLINIVSLLSSGTLSYHRWATLGMVMCIMIYKVYEMFVVAAFTDEIAQREMRENGYANPRRGTFNRHGQLQRVYTIDNPPSYIQAQNKQVYVVPDVELPPPYTSDLVKSARFNDTQGVV